jgi:hypothetical protein
MLHYSNTCPTLSCRLVWRETFRRGAFGCVSARKQHQTSETKASETKKSAKSMYSYGVLQFAGVKVIWPRRQEDTQDSCSRIMIYAASRGGSQSWTPGPLIKRPLLSPPPPIGLAYSFDPQSASGCSLDAPFLCRLSASWSSLAALSCSASTPTPLKAFCPGPQDAFPCMFTQEASSRQVCITTTSRFQTPHTLDLGAWNMALVVGCLFYWA